MSGHPLVERMNRLEVLPNALGFYGLGQVGVAIRGPEGAIYLDPYLTDSDGSGGRLERSFPPPLEPGEVTNADLVLVTHEHVDHFDRPRSGRSPRPRPGRSSPGPTPATSRRSASSPGAVGRPRALEPFSALGATVTPLPSAHTELEPSERATPTSAS
jgi:hypothetical protein